MVFCVCVTKCLQRQCRISPSLSLTFSKLPGTILPVGKARALFVNEAMPTTRIATEALAHFISIAYENILECEKERVGISYSKRIKDIQAQEDCVLFLSRPLFGAYSESVGPTVHEEINANTNLQQFGQDKTSHSGQESKASILQARPKCCFSVH